MLLLIHLNKFLKLLNKLKPTFLQLGGYISILFIEFTLIRIYEFFYLHSNFNFKFSYIKFELLGIYYDFVLISLLSIISLIPFALIYTFSRKIAHILFAIANTLLIIFTFILIDYLRYTYLPLDHAIFAYPLSELLYIAKTSVSIGFWQIFKYLIAVSLSIAFVKLAKHNLKRFKTHIIAIIFVLSGIFLTKNLNPARRNYSNDTTFNLTINKLSYFLKSSANYFFGKQNINITDFKTTVNKFQDLNPDIQYINSSYALEQIPDTTDLLGSYFELNNSPPNIVFIIMESLSSAFCGTNAYLGNFMPFLDSIISESLYWENFLSTSERTFNAIPSIFGSLPYAEKGFMQMVQKDYTVKHSTLIKWLSINGYHSNFYYGGWTSFDNMKKFLQYQNASFVLEHFGKNYSKIEKDENGFSWGYPDRQLFERSFEVIDSLNQSPRLDIYMTLSLHHPFKTPDSKYYRGKFENRMSELNFSEDEKNRTRAYSDIFSTVLYTDDALKFFFEEYKNRPEFKNTIFIITGDHRIGTQNVKNQLDKYHVPLIMYSPMIKEPVCFSSVSSHANIAPTLYPFLSNNYNFELPNKVHWLTTQIDTAKNFRNIHTLPLMRTNREISDYISGNYFLSGDDLFLLNEELDLELINNKTLLDSLKYNLSNFKIINQYITQNNLLMSNE